MQITVFSRKVDPFIGTVAVFIVALVIGAFLLFTRKISQTKSSPKAIKQVVITETPAPLAKQGGYLYIQIAQQENRGVMGQDMKVSIMADSNGKKINGFDVVLSYDPEAVSIVSVQNEISLFQIFSQKKIGLYSVSGILLPQNSSQILNSSPLITFLIRPLKRGISDLSLVYINGSKADSNLLSDSSSDILVKTKGATVSFGDEMHLAQGVAQKVPESEVSLNVIKTTIPDESCRDCTTDAEIAVKKGAEADSFSFQSGGFAGKIRDKATVFGYVFSLVETQVGQVTLVATPQ